MTEGRIDGSMQRDVAELLIQPAGEGPLSASAAGGEPG